MKRLLKKLNVIRLEEGDKVIAEGRSGEVIAVLENYFLPIVSSYRIKFTDGEISHFGRSDIKLSK